MGKLDKWTIKHSRVVVNIVIVMILVGLALISFSSYNSIVVSGSDNTSPIYHVDTAAGKVSIMFNVYWGTEYIPAILDTLKQYGCKATFFVGGSWADDNNDLLTRMLAEGQEIGNHGYFHKDHRKLSYEGNLAEIKATNQLVSSICNCQIKLFAPPSGSFGNDTLKACKELDMQVIMWSKDTIDWRDKDENIVFTRATKNVKAGDLILAHPTKHTMEALPKILEQYKSLGLEQVTVSTLLDKDVI